MTILDYGVDFDVEGALCMPPVYSLNLSSAQRSTLAWLEEHGAVFEAVQAPAADIGTDCDLAESTVYDALARLESLKLLVRLPAGYRINPRYFFATNPDIRQLVAEALDAPEIEPDARARGPRKMSNTEARRRRIIHSA